MKMVWKLKTIELRLLTANTWTCSKPTVLSLSIQWRNTRSFSKSESTAFFAWFQIHYFIFELLFYMKTSKNWLKKYPYFWCFKNTFTKALPIFNISRTQFKHTFSDLFYIRFREKCLSMIHVPYFWILSTLSQKNNRIFQYCQHEMF